MGATNVGVGSIVPGTGILNLGKLENAVHIAGGVGVVPITKRSDTAASQADANGKTSSLITDATGKLWVNNAAPVDSVTSLPLVGIGATPSGGCTLKRVLPAGTPLAIRGGGQAKLCGWFILNTNAAISFLQFFDVAVVGSITLGTTVPNMVLQLAASDRMLCPPSDVGINFANGCFVAATTTATGAVAVTTPLETSWFYK